MDPKACFKAYLSADHTEAHLFYDDLADWFARGGFGFDAVTSSGKRCYVEKLTHTRQAHVRYRNGRRAVLSERYIELADE